MAVPASQTLTKFIDYKNVLAKKDIIYTPYQSINNDQDCCRNVVSCLVSDVFVPFFDHDGTYHYGAAYYSLGKHRGSATTTEHPFCAWLAWGAATVTEFKVKAVNADSESFEVTISSDISTPTWRGFSYDNGFHCYTNGTQTYFQPGVKRTGGTGKVFCAGFCVVVGGATGW